MELTDLMRSSMADAFAAGVDAGAGTPSIVLQNDVPETAITFVLTEVTAFGAGAAAGVLGAVGLPITSDAATGSITIGQAVLLNGGGTTVGTMGVETSGSPDLLLSSLVLATDETMNLTAFTVTVLAGTADVD